MQESHTQQGKRPGSGLCFPPQCCSLTVWTVLPHISKANHNLNTNPPTAFGKWLVTYIDWHILTHVVLLSHTLTQKLSHPQSISPSECLKFCCWVHRHCWGFFRTSRRLTESRCSATENKASKNISLPCTITSLAKENLVAPQNPWNEMLTSDGSYCQFTHLIFNVCILVTEESRSGTETLAFLKFVSENWVYMGSLGYASASLCIKENRKYSEWSPMIKFCTGDLKQHSSRSKKLQWLLLAPEGSFKNWFKVILDPEVHTSLKMQMPDWYILLKYSWLNYSSLCCTLIDFALSCSQKGKFLSVCTVKLLICMVAVCESSETFCRRQGNQVLQSELLQIHIGSNCAHSLLRPEQSAKLRDTATFGW